MENILDNNEKRELSSETNDLIYEDLKLLGDDIFCKKSSKYKALCDKESKLKSEIDAKTLNAYKIMSKEYWNRMRNDIDKGFNQRVRGPFGEYWKAWDYYLTREGVLHWVELAFKQLIKEAIKEITKKNISINNPEKLKELMYIYISKIILQYRIKAKEKK